MLKYCLLILSESKTFFHHSVCDYVFHSDDLTDEAEDPKRTEHVFNLQLHQNLRRGLDESALTQQLLFFRPAIPKRILCCNSFLFVRGWLPMWLLFCHYLFLIPSSSGNLERLCFVIVAVSYIFL